MGALQPSVCKSKIKRMLTEVIEEAKIDRFARWMGHAERIVIVAHVAPDGDAIGSSMGV